MQKRRGRRKCKGENGLGQWGRREEVLQQEWGSILSEQEVKRGRMRRGRKEGGM